MSLESGFRTPAIMWSGVNPVRTSFGSAPASISAIASSKWPFCTASIKRTGARSSGRARTRPAPASSAGRALWTLHHRIHIGARREKRAHGVEVAPTHGKEERRKPGVECRVDVGSGIDQRADDRGVPLGRRPHQGRLAEPFACIGFGAAREQRLHRLDISGARSQHEDGFPAFHRGVRVGSGLQQQLHDCSVAVRACLCQRRHAIAIHGVHIGARSHEQCRGLRIIVIRGPVQRGGSIDLGGVHVDACPEERADAGLVALFRGVGERGARRRDGWGGEAERPAVRVH